MLLMFTGLAVSIAFRMLFWNIGAEGQLAMGAFGAAGVAIFLPGAMRRHPRLDAYAADDRGCFCGRRAWGLIPHSSCSVGGCCAI